MALAKQSTEMQLGENLQSLEAEIVDVILDTAYPTGGSAGFAAIVGEAAAGAIGPEGSSTGNIVAVIDLGPTATSGVANHVCVYHPETDKLQVFWTGGAVSTALAEVTNATNLSAFTHRFLVLSRGL
jgi:hypothetical protein